MGSDELHGGLGNDALSGDIGDDHQYGDAGNDVISGGAGFDRLEGSEGNDKIFGGAEDDTLLGGDGNDSVDGGAGDDDVIAGLDGGGNDSYNGGAGSDTLNYSELAEGVKIDLSRGLVSLISGNTSQLGKDKFTGFEIIQSGSGADTLIGNSGLNTLFGNDGDDILQGGGGKDDLYGGGGSDTFVYKSFSESGTTVTTRDILYDFDGTDKIDLSAIDAMAGGASNDAFTFVGGVSDLSTANANGALWFDNGILYASNDTDIAAEFTLSLPLMTSIDTNCFFL